MMFDMLDTGRRISSARKAKNMTQMELADKLGISYQAVSNWERGNSMPDISKLPELTEYLDITVDELFGKQSSLINGLLGQGEEYLEENEISVEEIEEAAPILKPAQVDSAIEKNQEKIQDLSVMPKIAPFLGKEMCDKMFRKFSRNADEGALRRMAPFVSTKVIQEEIQERIKNGLAVGKLMVFAGKEYIDTYAWEQYRQMGTKGIKKVAAHVSMETLEKIADEEYKTNGFKNFKYIAPFLNQKVWKKYFDLE